MFGNWYFLVWIKSLWHSIMSSALIQNSFYTKTTSSGSNMVFKKNITKWRFGHRFLYSWTLKFSMFHFTYLLCERHNTSCTRSQTNYREISYNIHLGQTTSVIEPCHNPMCTTITNKNLYYEVTHKSIRISSDDYSSIYLSNDHVLHVFDNNTANALWAVLQLTIHLKTLWTGTVTANFPTIWFQDNIRCREEGCYCQRLQRAVTAFWQVPNDMQSNYNTLMMKTGKHF